MNTSNNIQNQEPKAVREAKTGRECYAFALYVKGEIKQFICAEWWMKHEDALRAAEGMAITARISHKTAGIGIYQLQDNGEYWLTDTRNLHADRTRFKFHKSRLQFPNFVAPTHEEEREAHRLDCWDFYNGADRLPLGWMNDAPAQPYDLYIDGDCVESFDTLTEARQAYDKAAEEHPDSVIDILSADGETSYIGMN